MAIGRDARSLRARTPALRRESLQSSFCKPEERDGPNAKAGDTFNKKLFERLLDEEYAKLQRASNRDVHDDSKPTTLPIARAIVEAYIADPVKPPWYIDMLNINLNNHELAVAHERIAHGAHNRESRF